MRWLGSAATVSLLAACAPIGGSGPTTAGGASSSPAGPGSGTPVAGQTLAASGAPRRGGTLHIGQGFDIQITRPHAITFQHYSVIYSIFDTLLRLDSNNKPQPELAQSWDFSPDYRTLTLHLKQGVKFHTGRDFSSADVVWNIERVRDPKANSQNLTMAQSIAKMDTPDPATVVLNFDAPRPAVFDMLDALWILDAQSLADADNGKRWVGTGPFQWSSWVPNDTLEIKRFDAYWKPNLPYLDGISIKVIADPQTLLAQLQGRVLDLIVNPPFEQVAAIKQDPNLAVLESETGGQMYYVGLNVSTPPLDNKDVRHAINYGIDRERIVKTALSGIGSATAIPWPPPSLAYDAQKAKSFGFNLDMSKQLLEKAGQSAGFDLPLVTTQALPGLAQIAQIIQSDLAKVGVRVKIEEVESGDLTTRLTGRKFTHAWNLGFGFNNLHPSTMPSVAFPWRPGNNSSFYDSQGYRDVIAKLQVATDPAEAKQVAGQLTDLLLDESFVLPVSPQKRLWATRATVHDVAWGQEDALFLEKAWLAG